MPTEVAAILPALATTTPTIARVQALIRREGLGSDPDTQLVEDAACLVFIETQLVTTAADAGARPHGRPCSTRRRGR